MNFNSHLAVGFATAYVMYHVAVSLPVFAFPNAEIITATGCLIGSVLPDIDNPKSKVGHTLKPISKTIETLSKPFGKTGSNHRGIFHDLGLAIIMLVVSYFCFPPLLGFWIGVISHLILDALNPSGVPFLIRKQIHLLPYNVKLYSGGFGSTAFSYVIAFTIVGTYFLIYNF